MPQISVIIPVYNVEKYIVKCLQSILNQTFKDFEIILIDDGSQDKSIELVEKTFNDPRIKIYHKQNGGPASARNYGIKVSTGKYLTFIDPDDFIDINMFKDMYQTLIKNKVELVICDYYKYYSDTEKEHINIIPHYDTNNSKCSVIAMPTASCKLFKRELFIKNNLLFLENKLFEDNAIIPFACANTKKFSYLKKPYYYYLQRNGSILNKPKYDKRWEEIFYSLEYLYQKFKENNLLDEYYQELEYIYIEYLLHAANLRFLNYKQGEHNIKKVHDVICEKFPKWYKNKYYQQDNLKYRIICYLFYHQKNNLIRLLIKNKEVIYD